MVPRTILFCLIIGSVLMLGFLHVALQDRIVRILPLIKPVDGPMSDSEHELLIKLLNISVQSNQEGLSNTSLQTSQTMEHNPLPKLYPELHSSIPKKFHSFYKNPCWLKSKKLKCLPYFYLIGMPKCGTTDLWDKLVKHPQVHKVPKEPHWWAKRRNGWTKTPVHATQVHQTRHMTKGKDDSSVDWYLNWFEIFALPFVKKNEKSIFGDGSVTTSFTALDHWRTDFPDSKDPPYNLPDLMHSVQPSAKIVAIVRDPVSRFYSAHLYNGGHSNRSLKKAVEESLQCMETCLHRHTDRFCAYQQVCDQIFRGMYFIFLSDWIKAFGSPQVHVILLDDWISNPVKSYKDLITFLELDSLQDSTIQSITRAKIINSQNKKKQKAGQMLLSSKKLLQDFYRPYNNKLAELLNNTKFLWDYA